MSPANETRAGERALLHVVLFQPEIPPNTGYHPAVRQHRRRAAPERTARLPARRPGTATRQAQLPRVCRSQNLPVPDGVSRGNAPRARVRVLDRAPRRNSEAAYRAGDALLFGPETRGLPAEALENVRGEQCLRLPRRPGNRSLNLANVVVVAVYEVWCQLGFAGGTWVVSRSRTAARAGAAPRPRPAARAFHTARDRPVP